jgi:hypothetical protein
MVLDSKRAGHCTRCTHPFVDRTTAYMVADHFRVTSAGIRGAVMRREIALVCDGCVTPGEEAKATVASVCEGCGQLMLSRVAEATCSNRCAQRERRARRRQSRRLFCASCGDVATGRNRNAKFCSNRCRQKSHRRRKAGLGVDRLTA